MSSTRSNLICKVESGLLYLWENQYLSGYCILASDPIVASINDLPEKNRLIFLSDMARVGDALLKITGAYRINYAIMGNSNPVLHAHIVPRYANEPEEYLHDVPWSYPDGIKYSRAFDLARDKGLMEQIAEFLHPQF